MQAGRKLDWDKWEDRFAQFINEETGQDPAHDRGHVLRVVANAKGLAAKEGARLEVVVPAAWLHDCVVIPKNSEKRRIASTLAAERAAEFLMESGYPAQEIPAIKHAIAAHSFSAGIVPQTLEAKVVQDADRLDAIGAIGIARCFAIGGALDTQLYDLQEPFPEDREADDRVYAIDHFYVKLLKLAEFMHTLSARHEADQRTAFMRQYLAQLGDELGYENES
ncbi:MAG: HD domain-containing protein [Candidatus Promineifilaceae bacterium]|jgi:uncharacterized protein